MGIKTDNMTQATEWEETQDRRRKGKSLQGPLRHQL